MASNVEFSLPLEVLRLEKMASGHLCLNLSERVSWERFCEYGRALLEVLGGVKAGVAESVEMRIWTVVVDGYSLSLVFSDYPAMVSLESSDDGGDRVLQSIRTRLEKNATLLH